MRFRGGIVMGLERLELLAAAAAGLGLSLRTGVALFGLVSLPPPVPPLLPLVLSRTAMKMMMPRRRAMTAPALATIMSRRLSLAGEGLAAADSRDFFWRRPLESP